MIDVALLVLSLSARAIELQRPRITETVVVAGAASTLPTPAAVTVLSGEDLTGGASLALDDALRAVPGFSLFRRSSSRVANPTTQGVTLRGLAASGSSRALVEADGVPLNDPVGGWIYWNRYPAVWIREASVARGASGDLHGADALAGVVSLRTRRSDGTRLLAEGGSDATARLSAYGALTGPAGVLFGAAEAFTTDGFVLTAPEVRGPVDVRASSRHHSVHAGAEGALAGRRLTVRATHFGESRGNGTPIQRNSSRISQAVGDVAGERWSARVHGQVQRYFQTFSAVAGTRASERQTSEQDVDAAVIGGAADWAWSNGARAAAFSATGRYVDARLEEVSFGLTGARQPSRVIDPRQVTAALAGQVAAHGSRGSIGGGLRAELWQSELDDVNRWIFVTPRVWATYAAAEGLSLRAAFQTADRGPTINELYRPFRVGSVITEANSQLRPESAIGFEAGALWQRPALTVRALGFWSRVSDAIVNVTLSADGGLILRRRQNAARIRATGAELEVEWRPLPALALTATSAATGSVFAAGPLEGLRVPQVPRFHHTLGVRGAAGALRFAADVRYIGRQFDDDRNEFALAGASIGDVRAGWQVRRGVEIFAAVENVLDSDLEVGRTPLRTLGLPRTSRAGVRVGF